jgi:hypothetical protein
MFSGRTGIDWNKSALVADVNFLCESINRVKKATEALLVGSKEFWSGAKHREDSSMCWCLVT